MFDGNPEHHHTEHAAADSDSDLVAEYPRIGDPDRVYRVEALLDAAAGLEQQIRSLQAKQTRLLARFAVERPADRGPGPSEFAADEIALALRWSRGVASRQLRLSISLTEHLPGTLQAWGRGEVDVRGVEKLADLTYPLTADLTRQVEEAVLPDAPEQDANELARATRKVIARLDPDGAEDRHAVRKRERKVKYFPLDDGMAGLYAELAAADALAIYRKIDDLAHQAKTPGDARITDERRADVLTDLLLRPGNPRNHNGGGRGGGKALIQVTIAATTLMGLDEQAGELAGYGPITASVARMLAADAIWKRLITDPTSGQLLDYGRTTYRPPAGLADFVKARDHHCVFPGCARPADACEIDHRIPHPQGATSEENCECLCQHHHRAKHEGGWTLERCDCDFTWTSPTGRKYTRKIEPIAEPQPPPPPTRQPADDEPPPF
jgi:hypothetical protein